MNCIECGSCAYNCPAKRALVQSISLAKVKIKEMKKNG
jgi:electron transport complex protein RnfC